MGGDRGGYRDDYKGGDYKSGGYRGGPDRGGGGRQAVASTPAAGRSHHSNYDSGYKRPYNSGPQSSHHKGDGRPYKQSRDSYGGSSHQQSRGGGSYGGGGGGSRGGYSRR